MSIEFNEGYLRDITENAERSKSNSHRLDEVEGDIKALKDENKVLYEMSASIKTLSDGVIQVRTDVKDIKAEQGEMKSEIQEIKNTPEHKKSQIFDKVIAAVCGALGMALLSLILSNLFPALF